MNLWIQCGMISFLFLIIQVTSAEKGVLQNSMSEVAQIQIDQV